jgi:hypothetical protein
VHAWHVFVGLNFGLIIGYEIELHALQELSGLP